jgi:hypothetical protein
LIKVFLYAGLVWREKESQSGLQSTKLKILYFACESKQRDEKLWKLQSSLSLAAQFEFQ